MFEFESNYTKEAGKEELEHMHFTYVDNTDYPKVEVVFECDATNILEADALYKEATGKDVRTQPVIGCQISK
jgi:hypothetical protein